MEQDEYSAVVRSLVGKFIGSFISAAAGAYLSLSSIINLDFYSATIVGFLFFFCIGTKFFPESSKFIGRRARNFRRAKKGLEPLDIDDEPSAEINRYFQRKH